MKAQANPIDFMTAVFIFMVVFAIFMILWNMFSIRYAESSKMMDCELAAIAIADRLVNSGGYGANWTAAPLGAGSVGFANRPNELDWIRISSFASLNYSEQKRLLGTDKDFLIVIDRSDGASYIRIGQESDDSAEQLVEVTRLGMIDKYIVNLKVRVYGK
jgi:hypothetical protein